MVATADPTGRTASLEYDELDRLVTRTDAGGHETAYAYDDAGRLASVTDELDQVTAYDRIEVADTFPARGPDALNSTPGVLAPRDGWSKLTDPLANSWQTAYDAAGRIDHMIEHAEESGSSR